MTTSSRLSREQILALPPVITLAQLAQVLDVSEPTVRAAHRRDELEAMGIRVVKLGQQYRVVTSSVWAFLGLTGPAPQSQHPPTTPVSATPSHPECASSRPCAHRLTTTSEPITEQPKETP